MIYRKEIDGLRAIAVVSVILFHAGFTTFSGGFVGVDIFFVISGYLITTIIVDEMDKGSFSLLNFYERRARRLLPALFFMMLCSLPFAWFWMLPENLKSFSQSLVAVPLFASNVLFYLTIGYFETVSELKPLLHTWSLAVEEQYYFLFPVFLMLAWKLGKKWIISLLLIVAIISLLAAQLGSTTHPSFTFYLLPTRAFEILIGALISLYINNKQNTILASQTVSQSASMTGFLLVLYAIFVFDKNTLSPSLHTLVPTIGTGLILIFSSSQNLVGKLLGSKLFVGIGLISYSAYLWHQPLFTFAKLRTLDELKTPLLVAISVSTFVFGYLSWNYIEFPFRNKETISRKKFLIYCAIVSLLFVLIGLIGHINKGFPDRVSEQIKELISNPHEPLTNDLCVKNYPQFSKFNACLLSKDETPEILLLGDSHSVHYYKSIASFSSNKSVMNLAAWSCLPFSSEKHTSLNNCNDKINSAIKFISENNSLKIIILSGYWSYLSSGGFDIQNQNYRQPGVLIESQRDSFIESGTKVLDAITKSGKRVIFMEDIPDLDFNIQICFDMKPYKIHQVKIDCNMSYSKYQTRYKVYDVLLTNLLKKYPSIEIYSPIELFCSNINNICRAKNNDTPLYLDSDHLTVNGSNLVVKDLFTKHSPN
jgi:peptidoglycan/LPS O-acetylase OafA/YrhL